MKGWDRRVGLACPSPGGHGSGVQNSLPPKADRVRKAWLTTETREPTFWRSFLGKRTDIQLSKLWKTFLQAAAPANSLIQFQMTKKKRFISFPRTFLQPEGENSVSLPVSARGLSRDSDLKPGAQPRPSLPRKKTTKVKGLGTMSRGQFL